MRATHERVDGGGYPDGLAGPEIPLGARIIAVCDAYDAMTSDRSYRGAMTREDAIRELDASSGTQFDPIVVAAARTVLEHPAAHRPVAARRHLPRIPDLSPVARIQGLVDVIRLVRMKADPDRLLDEIARTIGRALGLETVVINMYRPAWDDFIVSSVHGNDVARATLLGSTYERRWFDPILSPQYLRRGAYVIEQGTFDWEAHLGDRYVPAEPPSHDPERVAAAGRAVRPLPPLRRPHHRRLLGGRSRCRACACPTRSSTCSSPPRHRQPCWSRRRRPPPTSSDPRPR